MSFGRSKDQPKPNQNYSSFRPSKRDSGLILLNKYPMQESDDTKSIRSAQESMITKSP